LKKDPPLTPFHKFRTSYVTTAIAMVATLSKIK
jgi:hypothetical protein